MNITVEAALAKIGLLVLENDMLRAQIAELSEASEAPQTPE